MSLGSSDVEVRLVDGYDELLTCVELQKETWGLCDVVPASLLVVQQKIGGVLAGAFDVNDDLVGLVFGMPGLRGGKLVYWSHMCAVRDAWRDRGVGRSLKLFQREQVLGAGIDTICWSYDPLETRNAHVNLNRLGAVVEEYVCDLYGAGADNKLFSRIGTDRVIVAWKLDSEHTRQAITGALPSWSERASQAPIASDEAAFVDSNIVRVEAPPDIQELKARVLESAVRWRRVSRAAFLHFLARGYCVAGFYREVDSGRCFYVLERGAR